MPEHSQESFYEIPLQEQVYVVEFCPYELSSQLILLGTETRVQIAILRLPDDEEEKPDHTIQQYISHGSQIVAASWSPETSIFSVPKLVKFATCSMDFDVTVFSTDLKNKIDKTPMKGHRDYPNAVCFDPDSGETVVSVGDDHCGIVWNSTGQIKMTLMLESPGMAVDWPKSEPQTLMVAEKRGLIRLYNTEKWEPVRTLDCEKSYSLMTASINPRLTNQLVAVISTDVYLFDTSESSTPTEKWLAHVEGCIIARWCRSHDSVLATMGRPKRQLKVFNTITQKVMLEAEVQTASGLSWHNRLPIIAMGGDKKVSFWILDL